MHVFERDDIFEFLESRNLLSQYKKTKKYLESGYTKKLKKRKPKEDGIYQFKINKKFRAYCYFETKEKLIVFEINDHQ